MGVFVDCKSLTKIELPESVNYIGKYAFLDCKNLQTVIVNCSILRIADQAFDRCTNLTSALVTDVGYKYISNELVKSNRKIDSISSFSNSKIIVNTDNGLNMEFESTNKKLDSIDSNTLDLDKYQIKDITNTYDSSSSIIYGLLLAGSFTAILKRRWGGVNE